MCFKLTNGSQIKVANKDIVVYKVMRKIINDIVSQSQWYNYSKEETKPIKLKIDNDKLINEGYHSFLNAKIEFCHILDLDFVSVYGKNGKIPCNNFVSVKLSSILVKCIIPKGTKYITNIYNQAVSEFIVLDSYVPFNGYLFDRFDYQRTTFEKYFETYNNTIAKINNGKEL